ncbi:hypothetical protein Rsub_12714 [Raphidocelis subcapitata]|uniref:Dihydrolipoamide acetyltransferase component of pyruvate dehydrogenase complex n=1 Tax=Raphidocelis subcapitata TaxID=307507 RepID=A0A2V0PR14_9CHLO|nr:hypothetical protein Rsub_12714 [Raphidocelis subcapitata]|eukprot:GBF99987.1 hypothetical protein Rsub_12714 [Raphidocelis subcapitata]
MSLLARSAGHAPALARALGALLPAYGGGSGSGAAPAQQQRQLGSVVVAPRAAGAPAGPARAGAPRSPAPIPRLHPAPRRFAAAADAAHAEAPAPRLVSFPLAQTGEGISECELVAWHVQEGDDVEAFQRVCEVQSDKASVEITSRYTGRVARLHHAAGDMVKVGAPLLDIMVTDGSALDDAADAAAPAAPAPAPAAAAADGRPPPALASPAVRALARELGVELSRVRGTGPGGRVLKDDVIDASEAAAASGPRATAAAAAAAGLLGGGGAPAQAPGLAAVAAAAAAAAEPIFEPDDDYIPPGRGDGGAAAPRAAAAGPPPPTRVPLRGYRRAMVRSATEAAAVPTFHYMDDLEMDDLMAVRAQIRSEVEGALGGAKLTYLPFVVKALSVALARFPGLNTQLAPGGGELLQLHTHNIGVAMATGGGLVVPNVKAVESKSIPEIAADLARLQQLAAAGKLGAEDLAGGSLTISNIGTIGGTHATPMLRPPEAAIVALGRVRALPRLDAAGGLVTSHVMGFSWGADHRVVDGAAVAEFSNAWKALLERPASLLVHLR